MSKRSKWSSGPPPSIGWWPASVCGHRECIRWWNGEFWSTPYYEVEGPPAGDPPRMPRYEDTVFWLPRPASWPARSRT